MIAVVPALQQHQTSDLLWGVRHTKAGAECLPRTLSVFTPIASCITHEHASANAVRNGCRVSMQLVPSPADQCQLS